MQLSITRVVIASLLLLGASCAGGTKPADIPHLVKKSARAEPRITETEEVVAKRIQQLGPEAIPYLLPLLKHEDRYVRKLTSYILRDMQGLREEHLDALMESRLKGDRWIPPAIARIGTPRAIAFLVDELKKEKRRHTQLTYAFEILGEKGVPSLVELVKSASFDTQLFATVVFIFGRLGDKAQGAIDPLIAFVSDGQEDEVARGWAVLVLGTIDKKTCRSVPTLLALARDEPEHFGVAVDRALQAMGVPEAVPGLLRRLEEKPDPHVFSAFAGLGENGKIAGPALVRYLSSSDWDMRAGAARAIARIGYTDGTAHLIKLLQTEDDWRLVYISVESLGRLHALDAVPALTIVSQSYWYPPVQAAAQKAILVIQGEATYESQDRRAKALSGLFGPMGIGAFDGFSLSEKNLQKNHPPYVNQPDHLNGEQLKKLAYDVEIVSFGPGTDGRDMDRHVTTIQQVPEVGIQADGGYLVGADRGEWGGELVFIDSAGKQTTLLRKNVHELCTMASGIVAVTGLSHLGIDEGMLFKVHKGDDGVWQASRWRALPDAPVTAGMLANGNLYVGCYRGNVEVSPSGDIKMAEK